MATILFVDDDEMERYFAREILEPRGHRVLYAGDGETALRVFDHDDVDVVVTDLAMPRLNGLRLIQQLREKDPHVKVIAASGINADQLDLAQDYGALAILQKPWDPRQFLDTLSSILEAKSEKDAEFEAVWPTMYSEGEFDEHGRLITPARQAEEAERAQATSGDDAGGDLLNLDSVELEVEEPDVPGTIPRPGHKIFDSDTLELEIEPDDEG